MTSPFSTIPPRGEGEDKKGPYAPWARFKNRLIIVRPLEYQKEGFITQNAPEGTDVVFGDVACLDVLPAAVNEYGDEIPGFPAGQQFRSQVILAGYLKGTFKRQLGKTLIGTIEVGIPTKGKPPLHFKDLSGDPEAVARGTAFLQQHPEFLKPVVPQFQATEPVEIIDQPKPSYRGQPAAARPATAAQASSLEDMRNLAAGAGYDETPPY